MARQQAVELRRQAPLITLMARVLRVHSDERAWRVGARGEEKVARRLERLQDGWRVLHAVPVGDLGSDIDHVVIGPGGVFTLNTKHHPAGRVWVAEWALKVNGQPTQYLRNSRHEASRATKLLSRACGFDVAVEPVLVMIAADITFKAPAEGVHVFGPRYTVKWLSRLPTRLTPETVELIFEQARRSTTWTSRPDHSLV